MGNSVQSCRYDEQAEKFISWLTAIGVKNPDSVWRILNKQNITRINELLLAEKKDLDEVLSHLDLVGDRLKIKQGF